MLPAPTQIFQFYFSISLWCHWDFFLLPKLGTDLLPQTAKQKVPGTSQWGEPSLVPPAKPSRLISFPCSPRRPTSRSARRRMRPSSPLNAPALQATKSKQKRYLRWQCYLEGKLGGLPFQGIKEYN